MSHELTRGGPVRHMEGCFDLYDSLGPMIGDASLYVDLGDGNAVRVRGVRRDDAGNVILIVQGVDPDSMHKHG